MDDDGPVEGDLVEERVAFTVTSDNFCAEHRDWAFAGSGRRAGRIMQDLLHDETFAILSGWTPDRLIDPSLAALALDSMGCLACRAPADLLERIAAEDSREGPP